MWSPGSGWSPTGRPIPTGRGPSTAGPLPGPAAPRRSVTDGGEDVRPRKAALPDEVEVVAGGVDDGGGQAGAAPPVEDDGHGVAEGLGHLLGRLQLPPPLDAGGGHAQGPDDSAQGEEDG